MSANPLNKIPTLFLDDGRALYDSRVICEYLDTLHAGPKLIPANPTARFAALRRQALGDGLMELNVLRLGEQNRPPAAKSEKHLAAYRLKSTTTLDALDKEADRLESQPDIGQIAIASALSHLDFRFAADKWREGRPGSHAGMPHSPSARRCWPPSTSTLTRGVAQAHRGKDTHPWSSLRRARSPASITAASATSP